MTYMTLPKNIAAKLRDLVFAPHSLVKLQELGVLAIGRVYEEGKDRVAFLDGAPMDKRLEIKKKVRGMMDEFKDEQETKHRLEDDPPDCTNFVIYFSTEESIEPTVEVGEKLNTDFTLVVLYEARKQGIPLDDKLNKMLDTDKRRSELLERAASTASSAYEVIAGSVSLASSSVGAPSAADPYTPAGSRHSWNLMSRSQLSSPSTTPSLREERANGYPPQPIPLDKRRSFHPA